MGGSFQRPAFFPGGYTLRLRSSPTKMSAGAVFKLIANDGKADRMIMATKLLNQRIKDVMCARKRAGKADITPTLVDLERTHILFVNSHFKPFAAIGYELTL